MQRPTKKRENLSSLLPCGGTIAVKVNERSSARKIFHECDLLDLDTDDV